MEDWLPGVLDLLRHGADVDARDQWWGKTALHFACCSGGLCVDALLKANASVTALDFDHWSPLHYAVRWQHSATAVKLIDAGADVNAVTRVQWRAQLALPRTTHNQ